MSPSQFNFPGKRPENRDQFYAEFLREGKILWKWALILALAIILIWVGWAALQFVAHLAAGPGIFQAIEGPSVNPRKAGFELLLKLFIAGCLLAALVWFLQTRR